MSTETSVPRQRDPAETALAELLVPQAPVGVALFGNDLRFTAVNAAFVRTVSFQVGLAPGAGTARDLMSPEEVASTFVGLTPGEAWPGPHGARAEAALRKVLAERVAITEPGPPLKAAGALDQTVESTAFWYPLSDGAHSGAALILTPAAAAEEVLRRREERYRSLVQGGAQVVWVAGPDGGMTEDAPEWRWITGQTFEEFAGDGWLESIHPEDKERVERSWRDSIRTGKTFDDRYRVRTKSGAYRHYDVRAVPIERDGRIVEWVGASTDVTSQREAEEMRGRLTEQLSAAALRTARLQQATSMLAEALTVEQVVEVITEVGRTAIGALRSSVALLEPDNIQLKVVNDDLRGAPDCAGQVLTTESPSVMTKAIQSRRPVLVEDPDELQRLFEGELEVDPDRLRSSDERSWVGLPLLAAGAPLGALRFSFARPRRITEEERVFLEALAGQCSLAVERAAMYEREHLTAETLQRSLLPERLPDVAGLVLAASYLPVARNMEVGGDWYDAFWLADRRLAVAVGDVMGKGLIAAAGMGRVRNALRALALTDPRPAAVLGGLDRLFQATELEEQVTTVAYLVTDPDSGEGVLGNAGHLPALVLDRDQPARFDEVEAGTPLGWASPRRQHTFTLLPGTTAVFYSDGLVENRNRGLDAGMEELAAVADRADERTRNEPGRLLQYLVDRMLAGHEQDDDVTVLVVHRP